MRAFRLDAMDRVRFGRALGVGAREAARALMKAADAAAAPNPAAPNPAAPNSGVTRKAANAVAGNVDRLKVTSAGVKRGSKRFGETVWAPVAKAGSVLWLEVTGVLFGMFALVIGVWVWKQRADLLGAGTGREREWFGVALLMLFGYLTVSSYVRASKRGRR